MREGPDIKFKKNAFTDVYLLVRKVISIQTKLTRFVI
jgi:hypothetical protein